MDGTEIPISSAICGEETPSRYELLSIVKKYSSLLVESRSDGQDALDAEMDERIWHQIFDMYFIKGVALAERKEEDDLVFFVRDMDLNEYDLVTDLEDQEAPFFVRRLDLKLKKVIGDDTSHVDWRRSFYLNFVVHTSYSVTVAICSIQDLRRHQNGEEAFLPSIYKVVKRVYASPSRINFQLGFKKAVETLPSYPDIYFAIDDFDDTFDDVILSESDHCYCVLLNAHGGAAFPENSTIYESGSNGSLKASNFDKDFLPKLTIFSGFVSYQMVQEAYEGGRTTFGSFLSVINASSKPDQLYMRGPGGLGKVEVAVSGITDRRHCISGLQAPVQMPKKSFGIGTVIKAASSFGKQAFITASNPDKELLPLKCCLMSITLPWELITRDLLFKAIPPVKL